MNACMLKLTLAAHKSLTINKQQLTIDMLVKLWILLYFSFKRQDGYKTYLTSSYHYFVIFWKVFQFEAMEPHLHTFHLELHSPTHLQLNTPTIDVRKNTMNQIIFSIDWKLLWMLNACYKLHQSFCNESFWSQVMNEKVALPVVKACRAIHHSSIEQLSNPNSSPTTI